MVEKKAFTLLEVVVTIVLLGIFSSFAFVSLQKVTNRSNDTSAKAALDRAVTAQRSFANAYGSYATLPTDLKDLGRDLKAVSPPGNSTDADTISLAVGSKGTLSVAVLSSSGTCFLRSVTTLSNGSVEVEKEEKNGACLSTRILPSDEYVKEPATLR